MQTSRNLKALLPSIFLAAPTWKWDSLELPLLVPKGLELLHMFPIGNRQVAFTLCLCKKTIV